MQLFHKSVCARGHKPGHCKTMLFVVFIGIVFLYVWGRLVRYFRHNIINWELHTYELGVDSNKTFNPNLIHI